MSRKNCVISPTAFKGTLTPYQAGRVMEREIARLYPYWKIRLLPLADGGDGTLEVLMEALRGKWMHTSVRGPLGKKTRAAWGIVSKAGPLEGKTAIIEMARASGLALTKGRNRVMEVTSYGTGQLIKAAMNHRCRNILIGVGGTATAEGGAGALHALGLRYLDKKGKELRPMPRDLKKLWRINFSRFDHRLLGTNIYVLCDVVNPLLGRNGSARVFGPQKGATPSQVKTLERFLSHWSGFAMVQTKDKPGAGAAGALAFGLSAFARARLVRGSSFVINVLGWEEAAGQANVILTGEGRLDKTSFSGKVIGEIVKRKHRASVFAICGSTSFSPRQLKRQGISRVEEMGPYGLRKPEAALKKATFRIFRRESS